ncbi:MAG: outer membrane lipoprotein-sorting protein [Cyclobacteriaceae bacterium]|nr:outer membrane lipoprotein-sorting protein [Cyclobacteriaceae bacterium]
MRVAVFFILVWGLHHLLAAQPVMTAEEIVRKTDANMRGNTMQAEMVIKTIRPTWTREMGVKTWMKGNEYAMILITSPAKDKGVAFLKRKKEVWNWVPTLERSIKLPPSMMSQSWMGTDFTNDDLVKESSVVEDYTHSFSGDTVIRGVECHIIRMVPKPEAAVVWGALKMYIDKKNFVEMHMKFYDEDGTLINIMNSLEIKPMGGRMIPTRVEMIPMDKKNQKTEIVYSYLLFDKSIDDAFFTLQQMKNLR